MEPIRALVVLEPFSGKEQEMIQILREFYTLMREKDYSRDLLYRDSTAPNKFVHLRIWCSDEARTRAQHDPDVHRFWQQLPELCTVTVLYEELVPVFSTYDGTADRHMS